MFKTVLCCVLLNIIEQTNADYVQNITLVINGSLDGTRYLYCDAAKEYVLLEGEPAEVILVHEDKTIDGNCHNFNNNKYKYLEVPFESNGIVHKSKFLVRQYHNYRWGCTVFIHHDFNEKQSMSSLGTKSFEQVTCDFRVRIRRIEPPVAAKVNGTSLNIRRTEPWVSEYDAVGYFDFVVGETINVVCEKGPSTTTSTLQYNFYNSKGEHVLKNEKNFENHCSFQTTLKSEYNNGYWDCVYNDVLSENKDRYVLRVYLRLQSSIHIPEPVIISCGAGVIITIIIIIICWQLRSYKRKVNDVNDWANVCNNLSPSRTRTRVHPEYMEILDQVDNNSVTYAVIYNKIHTNTPEYSNLHSIKPHGDVRREDEKLADIREEDVAYAEVVPKKENETKKYANVCTSDRYVNTHVNEYAEPAYCQAVIKD